MAAVSIRMPKAREEYEPSEGKKTEECPPLQ
jgi:hypothetical protein